MTRYIKPGEILGKEIQAAKLGNFVHIIINGKKETVKVSQIDIDPTRVYKVVDCDGFIKIYPTPNHGWKCSKEQYNDIIREGNRVINNMFGDFRNLPKFEEE